MIVDNNRMPNAMVKLGARVKLAHKRQHISVSELNLVVILESQDITEACGSKGVQTIYTW